MSPSPETATESAPVLRSLFEKIDERPKPPSPDVCLRYSGEHMDGPDLVLVRISGSKSVSFQPNLQRDGDEGGATVHHNVFDSVIEVIPSPSTSFQTVHGPIHVPLNSENVAPKTYGVDRGRIYRLTPEGSEELELPEQARLFGLLQAIDTSLTR